MKKTLKAALALLVCALVILLFAWWVSGRPALGGTLPCAVDVCGESSRTGSGRPAVPRELVIDMADWVSVAWAVAVNGWRHVPDVVYHRLGGDRAKQWCESQGGTMVGVYSHPAAVDVWGACALPEPTEGQAIAMCRNVTLHSHELTRRDGAKITCTRMRAAQTTKSGEA